MSTPFDQAGKKNFPSVLDAIPTLPRGEVDGVVAQAVDVEAMRSQELLNCTIEVTANTAPVDISLGALERDAGVEESYEAAAARLKAEAEEERQG